MSHSKLTNVRLDISRTSKVPLDELAAEEGRLIPYSSTDNEGTLDNVWDQLKPA